MSKKLETNFRLEIDPKEIKTRKRHAPGVRIIKSDKDKERKHKKNLLEEVDNHSEE